MVKKLTKKKPNLFIVGAPKCGTTFLFEKLKDHPDLFFTKTKETNYFSYHQLKKYSFYKDYKTRSESKYLRFYQKAGQQKYLIDASVSYFTFDEVPKSIKDFNSESKIIFLIRNPTKRAYSHYLMDKRMGYSQKPLQNYLKDSTSFHYRQYVLNSLYYCQYKKYEAVFSSKNILIIQLENLKNEFNNIFTFLGIEALDIDFSEIVNENKVSRNLIGSYFLKHRRFAEQLKLLIPTKFINIFKSKIYKRAQKNKISENDALVLNRLFQDDYNQIKTIIRNNNKQLY